MLTTRAAADREGAIADACADARAERVIAAVAAALALSASVSVTTPAHAESMDAMTHESTRGAAYGYVNQPTRVNRFADIATRRAAEVKTSSTATSPAAKRAQAAKKGKAQTVRASTPAKKVMPAPTPARATAATTKAVAAQPPAKKKKVSRFDPSIAYGAALALGFWAYTNNKDSSPSVSELAVKKVMKKSASTSMSSTPVRKSANPTGAAKQAQDWIDAWLAKGPEIRAASAQSWIDKWEKSRKKSAWFSW